MEIPLHSVIITAGPACCGKTTFARILRERLLGCFKTVRANIPYLSSDECRQRVLSRSDLPKDSPPMMDASAAAFELLYRDLDAMLMFPSKPEFVIVDSTGLSKPFHDRVKEICDARGYTRYNLVFDYTDFKAFFRYAETIKVKERIREQVARMRENYSVLSRPRFRIRSPDMDVYPTIPDLPLYESCFLSGQSDYVIIGDVHENVPLLQKIIHEQGARCNGTTPMKFILVGDFLDTKVPDVAADRSRAVESTRTILQFLHANRERFLFVIGNHEHYHMAHRGVLTEDTPHFSGRHALLEDEGLMKMFLDLFASAKPFLVNDPFRLKDTTPVEAMSGARPFIVTHSPCLPKHLAKTDPVSLLRQRYHQRPDGDEKLELFMKECQFDAQHFRHVFGHFTFSEPFVEGSLIGLDVKGDRLAYCVALLGGHGSKFKIRTSSAGEDRVARSPWEKTVLITDEDNKHISFMARNGVNYLSGTMPPSDSDADMLEPVRTAMETFRASGVQRVCIQPKYMGSRCQVYLNVLNPSSSYAVTRNGFPIGKPDLTKMYHDLTEKFRDLAQELCQGAGKGPVEWFLLDGELMPWMTLGRGLIDEMFSPLAAALKTEVSVLESSSFFDRVLPALLLDLQGVPVGEKPSREQYGGAAEHLLAARRLTDLLPFTNLDSHRDAVENFSLQVHTYGSDGQITYKPFRLLKAVLCDGSEVLGNTRYPTTSQNFAAVSDDEFIVCGLDDISAAELYFQGITGRQMEGIVIKPEDPSGGTSLPYLKVRDAGYLAIVYGFDHQSSRRKGRLVARKKTGMKRRLAVSEYASGEEVLSIPLKSVKDGDERYVKLMARILCDFRQETSLDPAL